MIGNKKTTDALEEILLSSGAMPVDDILAPYEDKMIKEERPFTSYVRRILKEKGISQKDLFIAADMNERTGRRIISGEKHTSNRDVILRICIAGGMNSDETQHALMLYGMSPLYVRIPRDALILHAIAHDQRDLWELEEELKRNQMEGLLKDE